MASDPSGAVHAITRAELQAQKQILEQRCRDLRKQLAHCPLASKRESLAARLRRDEARAIGLQNQIASMRLQEQRDARRERETLENVFVGVAKEHLSAETFDHLMGQAIDTFDEDRLRA